MSSETQRIAVINGPNLHWLGRREPEIYGSTTLPALIEGLRAEALGLGVELLDVQSNSEGALVDAVYAFREAEVSSLIVNAGAYTHTSVALRDALLSTEFRFVEVHISNVYKREAFRHHSYLSDIASGVIVGCGVAGYSMALRWLASDGAR